MLLMKNSMLLLFSLMLFSSCSSIKVITDYEKGNDFSVYKSYNIVELDGSKSGLSELDLRRIATATNNVLQAKGFKQMNKNADLEVHLHTIVDELVSATSHEYYGMGGYRRGIGWGSSTSTVDVTRYKEGTLFVDLVDRAKGQLVWQGIGTATLKENPKNREERINEAVAKILAGFPPSG